MASDASPKPAAPSPHAFVASEADKQRVTNYITVQSTTAFIFSIIMVLCAPQLLNPPATVLELSPCESVPCDPTDLSLYVDGGQGPMLYALYFFAWANAFFASTVGLASGLMNISAVVEAEVNCEGSGARLLHFFESRPQSWAGRTIRSFLRPRERVLEYKPFVSAMLVMIPLSLPLQIFFAFQMPAIAKYSAISDAYFKVTFLWFYVGTLISLFIFAPTVFIWSAYTACFTLVFSLALRIPYLYRLSHEVAAVHKGGAEAADGEGSGGGAAAAAAKLAAVRPEA